MFAVQEHTSIRYYSNYKATLFRCFAYTISLIQIMRKGKWWRGSIRFPKPKTKSSRITVMWSSTAQYRNLPINFNLNKSKGSKSNCNQKSYISIWAQEMMKQLDHEKKQIMRMHSLSPSYFVQKSASKKGRSSDRCFLWGSDYVSIQEIDFVILRAGKQWKTTRCPCLCKNKESNLNSKAKK